MSTIVVAWLVTGIVVYHIGRWMWKTHNEFDVGHIVQARRDLRWFRLSTTLLAVWGFVQMYDPHIRAIPGREVLLVVTAVVLGLAISALLVATHRSYHGY